MDALLLLFAPADLEQFEANTSNNLTNSSNNLTNSSNADNQNSTDFCQHQEELSCFHHTYDTTHKQVRGCCEVGLVIWSVIYLVKAAHELSFLGKKIFLDNMAMCPSRFAHFRNTHF